MSDVSILVLPPERWRDSKRLRLEALLAEPSAYASSYEDELSFADEVWVKRVNAAFTRDHSIALYAEIGGRLVGMVGTSWSDRLKMRHVAEVYAVYVKPSHRGKGIGKALMRRLLDELKACHKLKRSSWALPMATRPRSRFTFILDLKSSGRPSANCKSTVATTTSIIWSCNWRAKRLGFDRSAGQAADELPHRHREHA